MTPIHSFTFTRLTPPGQLSLPSALQRFVDSYEDLLLTPATESHQENTIPAETRQDLADFFDDTDLLTKSDAALIQLCISAFRSGAYPRDRKLTLNNININLENSEEVEFPENITLVNCTLGSPGQIRFYRGTVTATVGHAGVTALGPKAAAVAEEWLSSATAIDGATAIAQGSRTLAWAVGNGYIARAIGERSTYAATEDRRAY